MANSITQAVITAAQKLSKGVDALQFAEPTTHVYNPLSYAWAGHRSYLEQHACSKKKVVFLGMNPGPFGMAQTGVPFGEIALVRDWVGVHEPIAKPTNEHPKRLIEGFECQRSEVSGRRLWGLFEGRFESADAFFADHFVANYCPLVFMEATGRNRTPDKLPVAEAQALYSLCDTHLRELVTAFQPDWLVGVGAFAESRAKIALKEFDVSIVRILHPSPASPAANRGWGVQVSKQLEELGVWFPGGNGITA
jgi:single-strand selective monofunctional uracil DNA glycosylase